MSKPILILKYFEVFKRLFVLMGNDWSDGVNSVFGTKRYSDAVSTLEQRPVPAGIHTLIDICLDTSAWNTN